MSVDKFLRELSPDSTPHPNTPSLMPLEAQQPGGGIIVECTNCHRAFVPKRYWQHFCSDACRITHNKANPKKPSLGDLR